VRVEGARPPPLFTFTITSKVAVYAPAKWADTLTLFHLLKNMYSVVWPIINGTKHVLFCNTADRGILRKKKLTIFDGLIQSTLQPIKKAFHFDRPHRRSSAES
jgi:hypothetical protein